MYKKFILFAILILALQFLHAQGIAPGVKRILFLGNSITWAGNYVVDIEAYVRGQYPQRTFEFINAGLSSETVSGLSEPGHAGGSFPRPDLHERLARVLNQTKPDLVFACYGMNDGIYLPFDKERFKQFKDGMNWLHNEVLKTGAKIIHLTPPYYDELKGKSIGYGEVLDRYADWLLSMKNAAGWQVVDVHYPMKKYLIAHREVDKKFKLEGFALAQDGVHPGEVGHWIMAREVLAYLGFKKAAKSPGIIAGLTNIDNAAQYLKLIAERQNMMRDSWLTSTKHIRPGLPTGLPLNEAQSKSAELQVRIDSFLAKKSL